MPKEEVKKGVRFEGDIPATPTKKYSFFAGLGGNNFDLDLLPSWTEGGTDPIEFEEDDLPSTTSQKESCYQCFRLFNETVQIRGTHPVTASKVFCSEMCQSAFESKNLL